MGKPARKLKKNFVGASFVKKETAKLLKALPKDTKEALAIVEDLKRQAKARAKNKGALRFGDPRAADAAKRTAAGLSNVTPAFGEFVGKIGHAVADAQEALDKNMVETAKELSKTNIEVPTIIEQKVKDDGTYDTPTVIKSQIPVISFLPPVSYQWSRVHLQADMKVASFDADTGFKIQGRSESFKVGVNGSYGMTGGSISGSLGYNNSNYSSSTDSSTTVTSSVGNMHMEATLEPRKEIEAPKPFLIQSGATMAVDLTGSGDVTKPGVSNDPTVPAEPVIIGRYHQFEAVLKKAPRTEGGTGGNEVGYVGNKGQKITVNVDDPFMRITYKKLQGTTESYVADSQPANDDGSIIFRITRSGYSYEEKKDKPTLVNVTVTWGVLAKKIAVLI
ncbi:MAG: hypothetical protein IT289_11170 [Oligoflexia bacterium]|nr:hypothetical protein [Oligoflexia bacterium]